ncbi:unnamed protein product [Rhodiola kirilowii]
MRVKEAAGGVLANLALSHQLHGVMVEAGVIPKLAQFFTTEVKKGSVTIKKEARNALLELAKDEYYRILVIEEGLIRVPLIGNETFKSLKPVTHSWPTLPDGTHFEIQFQVRHGIIYCHAIGGGIRMHNCLPCNIGISHRAEAPQLRTWPSSSLLFHDQWHARLVLCNDFYLLDKLGYIQSALFFPCYVISIGRKFNLSVLRHEAVINVSVLIVVASLGKLLAVMIPSLHYNMPLKDSLSLGLLLNCQGFFDIYIYERALYFKV